MQSLQDLKAEHASLVAEGEAILDAADAEGRALTPAETQRYDGILAALRRSSIEISKAERPTFSDRTPQPSNALDDTPVDPLGASRLRSVPAFHPGARLTAFANTRDGHAQAYRSAQWLRAALLGDPKALTWCDRNGMQVDIRAAHSAGENVKGGVLVPEEFSATVIRLVNEYGVFRRNSRVVPMSTDTLNIPRRDSGLTAFYVGENQEGGETDSSWSNVQLLAKKLMILTRMSSELADDALISMADMLAQEAALAFAIKEDNSGFNGDGTAAYAGIVGVLVKALDAAHAKAKVTASGAANSCDVLSEIAADHLIDLMAAIPAYAKPRSKFYCSPVALELVFNAIKISAGGNSLENLANEVQPRFLGYPIELSEVFPGDPTEDLSGKVMIAFGNLAQASTLGARREIRFATTDARYWEQDQIGVKATMRHDINVHDLGSTTVKSPFAVLIGN